MSKRAPSAGSRPRAANRFRIHARAALLPGVPAARPSMPGAVNAWMVASSAVPSAAAAGAAVGGVATAWADAVAHHANATATAHAARAHARNEDRW